ncbi:alpha/beta hydrolase [Clostridium sp.]|uniref:alpha/beta hydrolase n=1 Tax=Clostridium sp. TaxID=1506 RepID=UPI00261916BB|nr:alpha/beta hydrolase [Clostridium sp.]
MNTIKKIIKINILTILLTIIIIAIYYKGPLLITYNVMKELKDTDKSVATLNNLTDYYALTSMDIENLKFKNTDNPNVFMDIYLSEVENEKSPVVIYVHGGSWVYGDNGIPKDLEPIVKAFNKDGFTIISLSYELLEKDVPLSNPVSDVKDAIRWVYKNKDKYNFNTEEIGLLGISSGAHLSLLAAYSDNEDFIGDDSLSSYPSKVKYVIDIFGPTELSSLDFSILDEDIKEDINELKNINIINEVYSPIYYIKEDSPNTLIIHSKNDAMVPYSNAFYLYKSLLKIGGKSKLLSLESGTHTFEDFNKKEILALIYETLKFLSNNTKL